MLVNLDAKSLMMPYVNVYIIIRYINVRYLKSRFQCTRFYKSFDRISGIPHKRKHSSDTIICSNDRLLKIILEFLVTKLSKLPVLHV